MAGALPRAARWGAQQLPPGSPRRCSVMRLVLVRHGDAHAGFRGAIDGVRGCADPISVADRQQRDATTSPRRTACDSWNSFHERVRHPLERFAADHADNTGLTGWTCDPTSGVWTLHAFNDSAHLIGLDAVRAGDPSA